MLVPSVRNVLAAYSILGSEWDKFVAWVSKKFPKQKFHEETSTWSGENVVFLLAGNRAVARYNRRNARYTSDPTLYSLTVFGDNRVPFRVSENSPTAPTFEVMKRALEASLEKSPIMVNLFNQKELHVEYVPQLQAALVEAEKSFKPLIVAPMERSSQGTVVSGDIWVKYSINETYPNLTPLMLFCDYKARQFYIQSFKEKVEVKTFSGFLGLLAKIPQIVKKGLATLPAHESAALSGKITSENVVSKVMDVKAEFGRIDEWHDTTLKVTLMLSTSQPVSPRLIVKWVSDHWDEVLKLAPSKVPAPSKDRRRPDAFEEPAFGLGWIAPNKVPRPDAQREINVSQEGKRAVVEVTASHR